MTSATPATSERRSAAARQDRSELSLATRALNNTEKVDRLAAAVAAGTYSVPPHDIAGSIIDETIAD